MTALARERSRGPADNSPRSGGNQFDLLMVPVIGRFLRWHWSRVALQIPVLILSAVMVYHAFFGPELAPKNLASLLTWVHFRGLVVLVLLLAGNFFCMACPFMLPRNLARRFVPARWNWPRKLRNKWPAIILFVGVLFFYELFDLWAKPFWTGVLIVGYFALAFAVDALFRRASFCKYVCPIGQFNFLASTVSPLEVSVREPEICADCQTKDCIRGTRAAVPPEPPPNEPASKTGRHSGGSLPIVQRGCELALFQPRKVGNLDCTFCLDCVYACPYDNVGIQSRLPGETLGEGGFRSGIGDLDRRSDWTALATVFLFGALLNAFAMVSPVYAVEQAISRWSGVTVEWPILGGLFFAALVVEPVVILGGAAWIARRWTGRDESLLAIVNRFARGLVPLGFGVWLAHYGFHFFTGVLTIVPVTQYAVQSAFGGAWLGEPLWRLGGLPERIVFPMEIGFLAMGLLGTLLVTWRIASRMAPGAAKRAFAPWAGAGVLLFATACWILAQPMDMRGTFLGG